jgi:hypothetical protein
MGVSGTQEKLIRLQAEFCQDCIMKISGEHEAAQIAGNHYQPFGTLPEREGARI